MDQECDAVTVPQRREAMQRAGCGATVRAEAGNAAGAEAGAGAGLPKGEYRTFSPHESRVLHGS